MNTVAPDHRDEGKMRELLAIKQAEIGELNRKNAHLRAQVERMKSKIETSAKMLREDHFSQAHTDMVGDQEWREGYLQGIQAMVTALTSDKSA